LTHVEPKQPGFELRVYYCASWRCQRAASLTG
jgi:hypothetical protein